MKSLSSSTEVQDETPPTGEAETSLAPSSPATSAELAVEDGVEYASNSKRSAPTRPVRLRLPIILFLLTCVSTFFAGTTRWMPQETIARCFVDTMTGRPIEGMDLTPVRRAVLAHWDDGLIYMLCMLGILFTHEMGHFAFAVYYRIRASLPFFIPMPIAPIGTMGAVIALEAHRANRREIFDLGLAGPIAGLIVALPILWYGSQNLDLQQPPSGGVNLDLPLAARWMITATTEATEQVTSVSIGQVNPFFMAGWAGLFFTGLNMMPVSQLDGGHVTYGLFGRYAHWIARIFMVLVFAYISYALQFQWMLMAILVLMLGTDHPPSSDDSVAMGWHRWLIGLLSLAIPILCFAPRAWF